VITVQSQKKMKKRKKRKKKKMRSESVSFRRETVATTKLAALNTLSLSLSLC
jgi:ABC-type transport system involved in cytochrome bd biosynthesis fused ATPase/permease subunit